MEKVAQVTTVEEQTTHSATLPEAAAVLPSSCLSSSSSSSSLETSSSESSESPLPADNMSQSASLNNPEVEPEVATILRALAPEEIDMLRDAFIYMDKDSDGYLSKEELFKRVCECVGEARFEPLEVYLKPLFEVADRDKDQKLSLTEFLMSFADGPGVVPAEVINTCVAGVRVRLTDEEISTLQENFRRINRKNDGFIDRVELEAALRDILHNKFPDLTDTNYEEIVTVVMESADADHDGKLSLAEFIRSFQEEQGVLPAAFIDTNTNAEEDQVRVLSDEETQVLREAFAVLDKDSDGYIDFVDLYNALWEALASSIDDRNQIRDLCDLIMATADRTKRGRLTLHEFIRSFLQNMDLMLIPVAAAQEKMRSACDKLQVMHDSGELEKLVMVFEDLDRNGDGYLDRSELVEVLKRLFSDSFPEWDAETLSSVMTAVVIGAESRHDGKLSLEEFIRSFVDGPGVMPPALVDSWRSGEENENEMPHEQAKHEMENSSITIERSATLCVILQLLLAELETRLQRDVSSTTTNNSGSSSNNNNNNNQHGYKYANSVTISLTQLEEMLKRALSQIKGNTIIANTSGKDNDTESMEELSKMLNYVVTHFGQFYNTERIDLLPAQIQAKVNELNTQKALKERKTNEQHELPEQQNKEKGTATQQHVRRSSSSEVKPLPSCAARPDEMNTLLSEMHVNNTSGNDNTDESNKSNRSRVDLASTTANPVYHKRPTAENVPNGETSSRKYKFAETYTNGQLSKSKVEEELSNTHDMNIVSNTSTTSTTQHESVPCKAKKNDSNDDHGNYHNNNDSDEEEDVYVTKRGANRHPTVHAVAAELADVVSSHLRARQSSSIEHEAAVNKALLDANYAKQIKNRMEQIREAVNSSVSTASTVDTQPGIIQTSMLSNVDLLHSPTATATVAATIITQKGQEHGEKNKLVNGADSLGKPPSTKTVTDIAKMMQMTNKSKWALTAYDANINTNLMFEDEMRRLFQLYDVEHKGYLDRNAFKKTYIEMEQYGAEPLPSVVDAQFHRYSRGSNKIYFNEFCILMLQRVRM